MYFRLRYILASMSLGLKKGQVLDFPYGGDHRLTIRVFEQAADGGKALLCEGFSEREVEASVEEAFARLPSGVPLDMIHRAFLHEVRSELHDFMEQTIKILRWRCSIMDAPLKPFGDGKGEYSFEGATWQEMPRYVASVRMFFGHPQRSEISEAICTEIVGLVRQGASESFEREMFREAWNLRGMYPKAALVIGAAAAEIGFRHHVGRVGGNKGILTLLAKYWPHPSPIPLVQGIQIKPTSVLLSSLKNSIHKRDAVVHNGAAAPTPDELQDMLLSIEQLLWIWDFYSGHEWALENVHSTSVST
jgi:hypothetical protein